MLPVLHRKHGTFLTVAENSLPKLVVGLGARAFLIQSKLQ